MKRGFYIRLAGQNIKKNGKIYLPYFLMCAFITAMYFIVYSLSVNKGIDKMRGASSMQQILSLGISVIGFFAVLFIFYINSFLMKRRKKEFGLYTILGMEKKHLIRVVFWENTITSFTSTALGIVLGIVFNKLVYMLVANLFDSQIPLGFDVSGYALGQTLFLFLILHAAIFVFCAIQVACVNPIELLHGSAVGEKEPKSKLVMAVIGIAALAFGYYLAVTTKNPVKSITNLMIAIVLVMVGTYLTFTAGSIALLKLLKKNKKYYYQTKHFIPVSGMLYRMKQNAFGLANIAIMSTGVLLMMSISLSLFSDLNNIINTRYPKEVVVSVNGFDKENDDKLQNAVSETEQETGSKADTSYSYRYINLAAIRDNDTLDTSISDEQVTEEMMEKDLAVVTLIPLSDYTAMTGEKETLQADEVLFYSKGVNLKKDSLVVAGQTLKVKKKLKDFFVDRNTTSGTYDNYVLVVKDEDVITSIGGAKATDDSGGKGRMMGITVKSENGSDDKEASVSFANTLRTKLGEESDVFTIDTKTEGRAQFLGSYSGILFIGVFLSLIFVVATVLIIYYKQITEGYDDKERFGIMKKVGLSKWEIRKAINAQIRIVFFLPLAAAAIHTLFAFPIIEQLLLMLNLTNRSLYLLVTLGCFIGFSIIYTTVYRLTSKAYYGIVAESK